MMRIGNLWASTLYKGLFVVLCAAALILDFGFVEGRADLYILNYYTVLSNIACLVFFSCAFALGIRALKAGMHGFAWKSRLEGAVVFIIAVTGIVYATMLAQKDIEAGNFYHFENLLLHYIGPFMVFFDWILFSPKGRFRAFDPLLWLLAPLSYFGYILVRSTFAGNIGTSGSPFPYDFIDPAVQGGWGEMFSGVFFIAVAMAVLGYAIYFIDRLLSRINSR